jgi:hypothetical protein
MLTEYIVIFFINIFSGKKKDKKIDNRKDKLKAELKLLEWHKMANEAAIKVNLDLFKFII